MTRFIQIHSLSVYPPSNPNRDDTGRPKTANFGGTPRLRISSQALKRAIRTSPAFSDNLKGNLGERTQRIGEVIQPALEKSDLSDEEKDEITTKIVNVFGKINSKAKAKAEAEDKKGAIQTAQLAFISPDEANKAIELANAAVDGEKLPDDKELKKLILRPADGAVDIAMFGRMLADNPEFNRDAAVQVSHAITTHRSIVEDDYYTAVDDRKLADEDAGSGFLGEAGFGSGVFYTYCCIDRDLLEVNLEGDTELAKKSIEAFVHAMATATPSGKKNSFAHQNVSNFILVEKGNQQPRSLSASFLKPMQGADLLSSSIESLTNYREKLEKAYGASADGFVIMDVLNEIGNIEELAVYAAGE